MTDEKETTLKYIFFDGFIAGESCMNIDDDRMDSAWERFKMEHEHVLARLTDKSNEA